MFTTYNRENCSLLGSLVCVCVCGRVHVPVPYLVITWTGLDTPNLKGKLENYERNKHYSLPSEEKKTLVWQLLIKSIQK